MNIKNAVVVFALAVGLTAVAAEFNIKNGVSNWNSADSFTDTSGGAVTQVPASGDTVYIPEDVAVTVADSDSASLNIVKALAKIVPQSPTSTITFNITGAETVEIPVPITAYGSGLTATVPANGIIVKAGSGTLHLSSTKTIAHINGENCACDYFVKKLQATEGTLQLPQNITSIGRFGVLDVSSGATIVLPAEPSTIAKSVSQNVEGFSGSGTITTSSGSAVYSICLRGTRATYGILDFDGVLAGKFYEFVPYGDAQALTGTANTFELSANFSLYGATLRVAKFGNRGEYGSLGKAKTGGSAIYSSSSGFRIVYIGEGETCNGFYFNVNAWTGSLHTIFDGGTTGGLNFNGSLMMSKSGRGLDFVFAGDNANLCTYGGAINDQSSGNCGHSLYLRKEGSGTWKIGNDTQTNFGGGISVDEGTLQFGKMADRGVACTLGTATNLTNGTLGIVDTNKANRVDYAIRLGAPTTDGASKTSGRLEYVGTDSFIVTNREIGVMGAGGLRNNGTAAAKYANIYGISSGEMTLFLDGEGEGDNEVNGVTDARDNAETTGHLSVAKGGNGKWRLSGEQTFSGDLVVTGGILEVSYPSICRWIRWTVTALYNDGVQPDLSEFCLMDANKTVLTQTIYENDYEAKPETHTVVSHGFSVVQKRSALLAGGEASMEIPIGNAAKFNNQATLFDNVGYGNKRMTAYAITNSNPDTWFNLTMHMRDTDNAVAGMDLSNGTGANNQAAIGSCVSNFLVSASWDGIHWQVIDEVEASPLGKKYCAWSYDSYWNSDNNGFYRTTHDVMHPLTLPSASTRPAMLTNVRSVKVGNGATLRLASGSAAMALDKLTVDASATAGTIEGFALASTGTLTVENLGDDGAVPINVPSSEKAKLTNWSVKLGSKVSPSRKLAWDGDTLRVVDAGLIIFLE